ncbi:MAG: TolC family protein [Lewinellaceae bacterium]|nr:TolC family protein [Saprospiraceae bacterium]MCB0544729.1 TolC family protein [Saprospiraceae bacterium]MCB9354111.1 TolC family protein [Lewinellaceae bacterium]
MFRKYTCILCLALGLHGLLGAQQTDFDFVVQPVEAKARDLKEYLIQLAWLNSPESAIAQEEVKKAHDEDKNTKKEWMRDVQATFNINEANLRGVDSFGNVFFPRYNFGVSVNLFNIVSQKNKNKVSKREIQIAEHKVNQRKLEIRSETLSRYASFKFAREIVKTRTLAEQEIYTNYVLIQQLYKTDEKTFEEYITASSAYYQAQEARMKAENDAMLAQYRLEEIIGLKWEQVQHPEKED